MLNRWFRKVQECFNNRRTSKRLTEIFPMAGIFSLCSQTHASAPQLIHIVQTIVTRSETPSRSFGSYPWPKALWSSDANAKTQTTSDPGVFPPPALSATFATHTYSADHGTVRILGEGRCECLRGLHLLKAGCSSCAASRFRPGVERGRRSAGLRCNRLVGSRRMKTCRSGSQVLSLLQESNRSVGRCRDSPAAKLGMLEWLHTTVQVENGATSGKTS